MTDMFPVPDFDMFWATYPSDLCGGSRNKGAKGEAKKRWEKIKDPEKVMESLRAQIRYDKAAKKKGEFVSRWPMASTWLNQERWDCEIDSHYELNRRSEEREKAKVCEVEGCENETHGPKFQLCTTHTALDFWNKPGSIWYEYRQIMKDWYSDARKNPEKYQLYEKMTRESFGQNARKKIETSS